MLHLLEVNTMNFCAFAACPALSGEPSSRELPGNAELLIAVPDTLASEAVSRTSTSPKACMFTDENSNRWTFSTCHLSVVSTP